MEPKWPEAWLATTPSVPCPQCNGATGRPVVVGLPMGELVEAQESGEIDVVFGGCVIMDDDPTIACTACGHGFGRPSEERPDKTSD